MEITYVHAICEEIMISAIKTKGVIVGLMSESDGNSYRIAYWNDGGRHIEWMYSWEITR